MSAPKLTRETFATSRAAEFFELRALQSQTGQPADRFGDVLVKELLDNALDAAETAGTAPVVSVDATRSYRANAGHADRAGFYISVADNGPGLPAEIIDQVLDFTVLVSDKSAYRSPTRGLQGNALKTVIGIPAALKSDAPVLIESCGLRHTITADVDPAGEVRVDHRTEDTAHADAARISVPVPLNIRARVDEWAKGFALVNPHAEITATYLADGDGDEVVDSHKPTVGDRWVKPRPTDPSSPHWYDDAALLKLVFAHIGKARRGGRDLPLGEFVRSFAGLTSTPKAKAVATAVPAVARLSDFDGNPDLVITLLRAMQAEAKVPKPAVLGRVDEDHYRGRFDDWYGVQRFWFKRVQTFDGNVPWIIEVATAETARPGGLFFAVNYSPTFDDPLGRLPLSAAELRTIGAKSFLRQSDALPDGESLRAAAVHLISPAVEFLDKGKSMLAVS